MPLPFSLVCDLLDETYELCRSRKGTTDAVIGWFARHRHLIKSSDCDIAALLSTLLPEKRTDRVYCIQAPRLERIVGRALMLGSSRMRELLAYKQPGLGLDLADCVECILSATPNPISLGVPQITVEEIDQVLHGIASKIAWSSPSIRAAGSAFIQNDQNVLAVVYRRLSPSEAKWFTRLVLKDYQPLILEPHLIYRSCDAMLPFALKIQDDFTTAIESTQKARAEMRSRDPQAPCSDRSLLATIKPRLSVKVGRQQWFKARSIKHCLELCQGRMSVENKMDGEYCQIHVDVSKGRRGIQIFSKSGKDSTEDRLALIGIVLDSLKIGKTGCNIQKECILEGELLVYSDNEQKILPFHHVRNHVARRGRFLGTELDNRPRSYEHLMIVYYDMLLLDGKSLLSVKHSERFEFLQKTVHCERGLAELVPRQIIDVKHEFAASALRKAFAEVIKNRGEGLVLKPDLPYFNFNDDGRPFSGRCIKFKKEYIGKFGEVGDFAVVGAGFNPPRAKFHGIKNLKWTHFFIGCLDNREEVKRWGATPEFTVVNEVELNTTMLKSFISHGRTMTVSVEENHGTIVKCTTGVEISTSLMVAFTNPPVFDVKCFGFEKAGNTGFWGLRFPAVAKIHFNRDFTDAVSFDELQKIAEEATTAPEMEDSQENLAWIARLEGADPKGEAVDASTQQTSTTAPTPLSMKPSQASVSCPPLEDIESPQSIGGPAATCPPRLTSSVSSTPTASHHRPEGPDIGKERGSPPSPDTSLHPHKRCKSLDTRANTHSQEIPLSSEGKCGSSRHPLEEIDGNSSQRSVPPLLPSHQSSKSQSQETADNTKTAKRLSKVTAMQGSPKTKDASHTRHLSAENDTKFDDEDDPSRNSVGGSSTSAHVPGDGSLITQAHGATERTPRKAQVCRYAGSKCQLANKIILLASGLLATLGEDLTTLLRAHGLFNVVVDAEAWVEAAKLRSEMTEDWQPGPYAVLFVDTVEMKVETGRLLGYIEKVRDGIHEEKRDWIGVYDWRVLKHISIMEDDSITKKYYDGFHDPWRRWYTGLI